MDHPAHDTLTRIEKKVPPRFSKWPLVGLCLMACAVVGWNGLMQQHWENLPVRVLTTVIPVPAATVNGSWITYHAVLKRADVLAWFRDQETDREVLIADALDLLVEQRLMEQLADQQGIVVTDGDVEKARQPLVGELSEKEFSQKIKEELHMTDREFTKVVLRPLALAQKLETTLLLAGEVSVSQSLEDYRSTSTIYRLLLTTDMYESTDNLF